MSTSAGTWIQTSRGSQSTWYDPPAQIHALLEYHSGERVGDARKLGALLRDHASLLSHDGRYILAAGQDKLLLCEPHVLGKVVKEITLPATPMRFAASEDGTRLACQLDDATVMILDGGHLARLVDEAVAREVPKGLDALAGDLAKSPTAAMRAARLLGAAGPAGVAALRRAVDGKRPDAKQVAGWIRELDSDDPATRDRAESSLAGWREPAEKALRAALELRPSAEARVRLRRLLARFARGWDGVRELAQARAVLGLVWNTSRDAARLLAEWAGEYPGSVLGDESKFARGARAWK